MSVIFPGVNMTPRCLCCRVDLNHNIPETINNHVTDCSNGNVEVETNPFENVDFDVDIKPEILDSNNDEPFDFQWFCSLLDLPFTSDNSDDLNILKFTGSTFCQTCSEILKSLKALENLLEQTRLQIQDKLNLVKANVTFSVTSEEPSRGQDDPRFLFIKTRLLENLKNKADEGNGNESQEVNLFSLSPRLAQECFEDLDIKYESIESHDPLADLDHFEPVDSEGQGGYQDDFDSDDITRVIREMSDRRKAKKRSHSRIGPKGKTVENSQVDVLKNSEEASHSNASRPRPPRKKRRKVNCTDNCKRSSKAESGESTNSSDDSQSDQLLLKRFGLDKLPELRIILTDVCKELGPSLNIPTKNTEKGSREVPLNNGSRGQRKSFQRSAAKNTSRVSKKKLTISTTVKDEKEDLEPVDLQDPDFQPPTEDYCPSDFSADNADVGPSGSDDDDYVESIPKRRKLTKHRTNPSEPIKRRRNNRLGDGLRANKSEKAVKSSKQVRRKRDVVYMECGKRYFRTEVIEEEGNSLLCPYKPCDFKSLIIEGDDDKTNETILKHCLEKHKDEPYRCKICHSSFKKRHEYDSHRWKYHPRAKMFECNVCGRPLGLYGLKTHWFTHLSESEKAARLAAGEKDPFETFAKEREKLRQTSSYMCSICGQRFIAQFFLTQHEKTHIKISERPKIMCDQCPFVFTTQHGLNAHKKRVHNPEEYMGKWKICTICEPNKRFTIQTHLDIHNRRHHGADRIHICDHCGKSFNEVNGLKKHLVIHSDNPRPYKCPFCTNDYLYPNNLHRHIVVVHKDKNYVKPEVKKIINNGISRPASTSLPVMTCKQMFPCDICDEKYFSYRSFLKKHMVNTHGHEYVYDRKKRMRFADTPKNNDDQDDEGSDPELQPLELK